MSCLLVYSIYDESQKLTILTIYNTFQIERKHFKIWKWYKTQRKRKMVVSLIVASLVSYTMEDNAIHI